MTPKVEPCKYNPLEVHCTEPHKCKTCGWNPEVAKMRLEKTRRTHRSQKQQRH